MNYQQFFDAHPELALKCGVEPAPVRDVSQMSTREIMLDAKRIRDVRLHLIAALAALDGIDEKDGS